MKLGLAPILLCAAFAASWPMGVSAKAPAPSAIHLEAEDAALTGAAVMTQTPGFSGKGYVGDFAPEGAKIVWTVPNARAGLYDVRLRYRAPSGQKGYDLAVNGRKASGMLPATATFATVPGGKVELLAGANTVEIDRGWGYYEIDALDLTPAPPAPPLKRPRVKPSDPQATPQARALLRSLVGGYGTRTLSGQSNWADNQYVRQNAGATPAVLGMDLIEYSPTRLANGSKPGRYVEDTIKRGRQTGQIVTVHWHWNAPMHLVNTQTKPWWRGFYTDATTFNVRAALDAPASPEYQKMLGDMDAIAVQLQKYQMANVPVLWRPLHEAEGGWFWWGAQGPEAYKKLWRLMHDRLTRVHKLHNLLWVYSSGTDPRWYPGDDVVDVVGIDQYPTDKSDPLVSPWETLQRQYGGRKILALSEFGGVPDVARMRRFGVRWSYFMSWDGTERMPAASLSRLYHAPGVANAHKPGSPGGMTKQ